MFRFHKPLDIITLFHKASSPASVRLAAALRQASAAASETSAQTEDDRAGGRPEFKLEITESLPTADQLRTMLDYAGRQRVGALVQGASDEQDALRRFKENAETLQRPVVVDWNNGKVAAGENESEILKMLNALPK
ncbi:hypothetical protein VTH06DRAFT_4447 [Thermothelomyces fergusii]